MKKTKKRIKALAKRLNKNFRSTEMQVLPGQLAFFFLLMLVPLIALVFAISSNFNVSNSFLNRLIANELPNVFVQMIETISKGSSANINNIIFYISALILASNGTYTIIVVSNRIYHIKNRGYLYDRAKSVGILFIMVLLFLFIMIVPVLGNQIVTIISTFFHNDDIGRYIRITYKLFNLPISYFIIFWLIKIIYIMAPDAKISRKNVNYGVLFTSLSWVLFTKLYAIYIGLTANVNSLYGNISNIIILMWWIYFLSYIFVMGMALNVSKYEEKEK